RVEKLLDRAHGAVKLLTKNASVELAAHQFIAMLAAVVAAELCDQGKHFVGHHAQRLDGTWLRKIHEWPDVQTAGRRMSVESCPQIMSLEQLGESSRVGTELRRIDGGILDERNGPLAVLSSSTQQTKTSFAKLAKTRE